MEYYGQTTYESPAQEMFAKSQQWGMPMWIIWSSYQIRLEPLQGSLQSQYSSGVAIFKLSEAVGMDIFYLLFPSNLYKGELD